ncbi:FAD-dependent oxidoreductase [Bacillus sp. JCM 19041]|uniref:FAD-dependent oxidoreductase n=1 Tax=Bacillus sp. JCM 19041 TaxID=1460637 RepID=UPI0006D1F669
MSTQQENKLVDVIVVGAGLAGLSAALTLNEQGFSYKIVEASNHAGGKVSTVEGKQSYFEKGAQFINPDMTNMVRSLEEPERHAYLIDLLVNTLGDQAAQYLDSYESIWVDHPSFGGGFNASIHLGGLPHAADLLREPFENVVFASSELAESFPSFMEGAVHAGKAAANRIMQR